MDIFESKRFNQILILLIFLLNGLFIGYSLNTGSQMANEQTVSTQVELPNSVQHTVDSKTKESVQNELQKFTGGFIEQGINGDPDVKYFIQNPSMAVGFGTSSIKMLLKGSSDTDYTGVSITFPNSNTVVPEATNSIVSKGMYFIGTSVGQIKQEYSTILYKNLYNHIDLEYTIKDGQLKYNFFVYPGGDPANIILQWNGPVTLEQTEIGMQITVSSSNGQIVLIDNKPIAMQEGNNIDTKFDFHFLTTSRYKFTTIHYDNQALLIIDPTILYYSSYFGAKGTEYASGIAVDNNSNAYVTGYTTSTDFPIFNAYDSTFNGGSWDVFVFKLSLTTSSLIYSTYIGGGINDYGNAIAIDKYGYAYVTGYTDSSNFPTLNAYSTTSSGYETFVFKLNPSGTGLVYSTFVGGTGDEKAYGLAIDSSGNAFITGSTTSTDFPVYNAYDSSANGGIDCFVFELWAGGNSLSYSTYLGGSLDDIGKSIAIDNSGNIYVTGYTSSLNFPTQYAFNSTNSGGIDVFVSKLSIYGSLYYSTYIGGGSDDYSNDITIDVSGNAYVTGYTPSTNFPTVNAYDTSVSGTDIFVFKLASSGSTLIYSTFVGGSGLDYGYSITVDNFGNTYVTGYTQSNDFPTVDAFKSSIGGANDAYVFKLSPNGSNLLYSTYIGGSTGDIGYGIALDNNGNIYVTGVTSSSDFPTINDRNGIYMGNNDGFVIKLLTEPNANLTPSSVSILQSYSQGSLELVWNAPTFLDSFLHYNIYRESLTDLSYSLIGSSNTQQFIDSNITFGVYYFYKILPVYSFGSGFNTTEIFGILPTVPDAPSLQVTAGNNSVYLSWTAPVSDGGSIITNFNIRRGLTYGFYDVIASTNNFYYNDTDVDIGTRYYYVVSAVNARGESIYSTEYSAIPVGVISTVPGSPAIQDVIAGNRSVYISWLAPDDGGSPILEYQIYRGTEIGHFYFIGVTYYLDFNDTMLAGGTEYYYVVVAVNALGKGAYSAEYPITPYGPASFDQTITKIITITNSITSTVKNTDSSSETVTPNTKNTNTNANSSPGFEFPIIILPISLLFLLRKRSKK